MLDSVSGRYGAALKRHPATWTLAATCVAVYIAEVAAGGDPGQLVGQGPVSPVVARGALVPQLVLQGEVWRMVTAGFIHFDFTHILFNLVGLVYGGRWCEERFGSARMLAIFILAVVVGDVAALLTTLDSHTITAGASGGIMGLFAAMGVLGYRFPAERESLARAAGPIIATLLNGLVHPGVSNAGHVGGLLGGAVSAAAVGPAPGWARGARAAHEAALRGMVASQPGAPAATVAQAELEDPENTRVLDRTLQASLPLWGVALVFGAVAGLGAAAGQVAVAAVAGVLAALGVAGLINHARLVLTPAGFEVRQRLWRSNVVHWVDVESILLMQTPRGTPGGLSYTLRPEALHRRSLEAGLPGRANPRSVPTDFGLSAREQGQLMEAWRRRWVEG